MNEKITQENMDKLVETYTSFSNNLNKKTERIAITKFWDNFENKYKNVYATFFRHADYIYLTCETDNDDFFVEDDEDNNRIFANSDYVAENEKQLVDLVNHIIDAMNDEEDYYDIDFLLDISGDDEDFDYEYYEEDKEEKSDYNL